MKDKFTQKILHPSTSKLTNAETASSGQPKTGKSKPKLAPLRSGANLVPGSSVDKLSSGKPSNNNYILNLNFASTAGRSYAEFGGDTI